MKENGIAYVGKKPLRDRQEHQLPVWGLSFRQTGLHDVDLELHLLWVDHLFNFGVVLEQQLRTGVGRDRCPLESRRHLGHSSEQPVPCRRLHVGYIWLWPKVDVLGSEQRGIRRLINRKLPACGSLVPRQPQSATGA